MRPILLLLAFVATLAARPQLVINELLQSNVDCLLDDRNEYPDSWVELHNTSKQSINLRDYSIGLTADAASAWALPNQTVSAGSYVVVFCDKESKGLHTDFRLESGKGGEVHLFRAGQTVDALTDIPKQPAAGVAFARFETPSVHWAHAVSPTPGAANGSVAALGVLADPVFSAEGGVYRAPQTLALTLPSDVPAGTLIRYTTDGSEPTASSSAYTHPLHIGSTTTLRAKLFCSGWASPRALTHSYIFPTHKVTLPIVSIVTDRKHLTDSKTGILVDGNYSSSTKNYQYDWRRPINLEVYEPTDDEPASDYGYRRCLNQLCETRVMGAASRGASLKSLAVYAHKRFGEKHFDYAFFPDQRPDNDRYKSFLLRNAGNDFDYLYMRDAIVQRTMAAHTDLDWQAWRPAVVYINGEYKGILNFRDRSNDDNIATYYDGLDDIDMIKNHWELQHGTWDNYNAFKAFYEEHGHTYDEYAEWMDLDEYITVMAMNLYYNNFDFPGNNIVFWRPRAEGGRWRIIVKDTDYTLGIYDEKNTYNAVEWINNADYDGAHNWANGWDHTRLFRRLMEDMDFRRTFLERSIIYMGDFMNERGTRATWDAMYALIKDEYPIHRALYNRWWPNYDDELQKARKWLAGRTALHLDHLVDYYNTATPRPLLINTALPAATLQGVRIAFNDVQLSEGTFYGKFYEGSTVHLTSRPATPADAEAYRRMHLCAEGQVPASFVPDASPQAVTGWRVAIINSNGSQVVHEYSGDALTLTMPDCACLQVTALTEEASALQPIYADEPSGTPSSRTFFDLQGRPSVGSRRAGIYIGSDGRGRHTKVVLR